MNVLICDDDYRYVNDVKKTVETCFLELNVPVHIETYTDGEEVLNNEMRFFDIAILDVEIGNIKGMQIAEKIRLQNSNTLYFFITAYESYLDDAMNLFAFRFLTKPLDVERLKKGLKAAADMIDKTAVEFMVKDGDIVQKVFSNDIVFIEITGRYTKVVTTRRDYTSTKPIEFWQDKLSPSYFYRVHKSFIINTNYITKYTRDNLLMYDKYNVPISYRERPAFKQYITRRIEEMQK